MSEVDLELARQLLQEQIDRIREETTVHRVKATIVRHQNALSVHLKDTNRDVRRNVRVPTAALPLSATRV